MEEYINLELGIEYRHKSSKIHSISKFESTSPCILTNYTIWGTGVFENKGPYLAIIGNFQNNSLLGCCTAEIENEMGP